MTPQNTFSLSLLAALVEDVVVDGRPLSHAIPAEIPSAPPLAQWIWHMTQLGDTLLSLAEQECTARPGMFRSDTVAAPPSAATLTTAVRKAEEWVCHPLRVFPSGTDGSLAYAVHAAVTHLIASLSEPRAKSAYSYAVVQAMMNTVARHRHHEKPGQRG